MPDKFSDVFLAHQGKPSDKWSAYLPVYDEVFEAFRSRKVSLLEIGVQNGGSLEVYSKFFPYHDKIIGCDIHPRCADLTYLNPRVQVIVGDCTAVATRARIFEAAECFDLIIDDGSHRSDDIVQTFLMYFAALKPGGVYVAEDLHASYWRSFGGGLRHGRSALAFFKLLIDVINAEHWGIDAGPRELINRAFPDYAALTAQIDWRHIASVAFFNSMCVVRKPADADGQTLGPRVIKGENPTVFDVMACNGADPIGSDERGNPDSQL